MRPALAFALVLSVSCGPSPHPPMSDAAVVFGPRTGSTCPTPAVTYASFGQTFFATYCTSCHSASLTGAARVGAPVGFDYDSAADIRMHVAEIDEVAASGPSATNTQMPFAGPTPTLAERQMLGQLLACGVPD